LTYTKCAYPGCKKKAEAHYQSVGSEGNIGDLFDLCLPHLCHGEKSVLRNLGKIAARNKYKKSMATASVNKKDEKTQEALTSNKDTLTLSNYKEITGRRFRMTKAQKSRGISREEAFNELMTGV